MENGITLKLKLWQGIFALYLIVLVSLFVGYQLAPKYVPSWDVNFKHQAKKTGTEGTASWYHYQLKGVWWSKDHRTCASRSLKRYSTATITNLANNKQTKCFVNDYGPEAWTKREIDLSWRAFADIADPKLGLIKVKIE